MSLPPIPTQNVSENLPRDRSRSRVHRQHLDEHSLRETLVRYLGHFIVFIFLLLGIWASGTGFATLPADAATLSDRMSANSDIPRDSQAEADFEVTLQQFPAGESEGETSAEIARQIAIHTNLPSRPRLDVIKYVVQPGDNLFGIASLFGLKPETVLWGNYDALQDDPHSLQPGQELAILPIDGTAYVWHQGDGLSGVAAFFGVEPVSIIEWPGNNLPVDLDIENPDIEAGTLLVIPGGKRDVVTWRAPRITRANPASARILGAGYCGSVYDGPVGTDFFVWPTPGTTLSGYHFDPVVHPAIDIGGDTGYGIFASDTGVVVYAGWNDYGYGNVIVLDHGNGWQTLYAHLNTVNVICGQAVYQGDVIAGMGSTGQSSGPHLHFEMMSDQYGKVNPLNFLP